MVCVSKRARGSSADVVSEPPRGSRDRAASKLSHTEGRKVASCGHYIDKAFQGDSGSSLLSLAMIPGTDAALSISSCPLTHHTGRQYRMLPPWSLLPPVTAPRAGPWKRTFRRHKA